MKLIARIELSALVTVAVAFSIICLWRVCESDLFFYVRFGHELLNFHSLWIDQWTYTVRGLPWVVTHWLSYPIFAIVDNLGGVEALSIFRSVLIFLYLLNLGLLIFTSSRVKLGRAFLLTLLPPIVLIICQARIALLVDFISVVVFLALMLVTSLNLNFNKKVSLALLLLLLFSNLHGGTYPFAAAYFVSYIWGELNLTINRKFALTASALLLWFATPNGYHIVTLTLNQTFNYWQWLQVQENPDYYPLSIKSFTFAEHGWSYKIWAAYSIIALFGFVKAAWPFKSSSASAEKLRARLLFACWVLFTLVVVKLQRAITYQTALALPAVATALSDFIEWHWQSTRLRRLLLGLAAAAIIIFFCGQVIPDNLLRIDFHTWGVGIDKKWQPVDSVEFVKKYKPLGEILNDMNSGGYLMYTLPDRLVAIDGRDIPFLNFLREKQNSERGSYNSFVDKYKFNTIVRNYWSMPYPISDWALVFMDSAKAVYLKRIPEHQDLIRQFEYVYIGQFLTLSGTAAAKFKSENVKALQTELERCIEFNKFNLMCNAQLAEIYSDLGRLSEAIDLLNAICIKTPTAPWAFERSVAIERRMGHEERASDLEAWLQRLK